MSKTKLESGGNEETPIEKVKELKIKLEGGNVILIGGIILIIFIIILWLLFGYHYVWIPAETSFESI